MSLRVTAPDGKGGEQTLLIYIFNLNLIHSRNRRHHLDTFTVARRISAIFECLHRAARPGIGTGERRVEVLISQVTRRWRTVALNTPQLWTQIHARPTEASVHIAKTYLSGSGVFQLDMRLKLSTEPGLPMRLLIDLKSHDTLSRLRQLFIAMTSIAFRRFSKGHFFYL